MKKLLIVSFVSLSITGLFGQTPIKLIPIDYQKKNLASKVKEKPSTPEQLSKNEQNSILLEVNPADKEKEAKAQKKIIKLYDSKGNLLASSKPIGLEDMKVVPFGDDNTVLAIFPAGTASFVTIIILKRQGDQLIEIKTIIREARYCCYDISKDGQYLVVGYSAWTGISNEPEIKLFSNNGEERWSKKIDEKDVYSIFISKERIAVSTKGINSGRIYLFNYMGEVLARNDIDDVVGNYRIVFSNDLLERFYAISTVNRVYLFDSQKIQKIKELSINDKEKKLSSYTIDKGGNIIASFIIKNFSKERDDFNISEKELVISFLNNQEKRIMIEFDGEPKMIQTNEDVILEMWSISKKSTYYEVQY